tara:strand:+ start:20162 stop:20500 length:339 start_codon:yes stop_codon:yes gene_type:complete
MGDPVTHIRNVGPASVESYARAGITTAQEVRKLGPDATYARLIASGARPHFIGYYALVMGLQGRPWNDCKGQEKVDLRARFDAICVSTPAKSVSGLPQELDRFLRDFGLREG